MANGNGSSGSISGLATTPGSGLAIGTGTGPFGAVTTPNVPGPAIFSWADVWSWLNTPFTSALSPVNMFLIVGVIIVAIIMWNLILFHIRIAAETVI